MIQMKDNTEEHDTDPNDAIETLEGTEIDESTTPNHESDNDFEAVENADCVGEEWCDINLNDYIEDTQGDEQE